MKKGSIHADNEREKRGLHGVALFHHFAGMRGEDPQISSGMKGKGKRGPSTRQLSPSPKANARG